MSDYYTQYEIVEFVTNDLGIRKVNKGLKIGELVVARFSEKYRIYNPYNGRPIFNAWFVDKHLAVEFAERLDEIYKDYWILLKADRDYDVFSLTKYSVVGGTIIYEMLNLLKKERGILTREIIKDAHEKAEQIARINWGYKDEHIN